MKTKKLIAHVTVSIPIEAVDIDSGYDKAYAEVLKHLDTGSNVYIESIELKEVK